MIVLPAGHALAQQERITLEQLAGEPLISYHPSFTGRTRIDQAFAAKGLAHTSLYLYLDILLSGVFAYAFLGERFGALRLVGAAVILLGVHLAAQRLPPEPAG